MCARIPALGIRLLTGREQRERVVRALVAGAAAGGAGFSGFVAVHSFLIAPIWDRSLHGIPFALLAGTALAWAFEAHHGNEFVIPLSDGARFGAIMFATLVPATVFANAMRLAGLHPNDWPGLVIPTAIAAATGAVQDGFLPLCIAGGIALAISRQCLATTD